MKWKRELGTSKREQGIITHKAPQNYKLTVGEKLRKRAEMLMLRRLLDPTRARSRN